MVKMYINALSISSLAFAFQIHLLRGQLAECALLGAYNNDPVFSEQARMVTALAYLPPEHVPFAAAVLEQALADAPVRPFLDWFVAKFVTVGSGGGGGNAGNGGGHQSPVQ